MTQIDDDDFETSFEEFSALSEAQQDAMLEREMAEYCRWFDSLTPLEQYRVGRRSAVEGALVWRRTIRMLGAEPGSFFHEQLRDRQKRMARLRIKLATGQMPGTA